MCELLNESEHWTFRTLDTFRRWLQNFDAEDRWLAAILLDKLTAISATHQTECLRQCLQEWLLHEAASHGPYASLADKRTVLKEILRHTAVAPVCGEDPDPSDSGNTICRDVRYLLGDRVETLDTENAIHHAAAGKRLILVDDCVGSGSQVDNTLDREYAGISLRTLLSGGRATRIALVGTIGESVTLGALETIGIACFFAYRLGDGDRIRDVTCEPHYPTKDDGDLRLKLTQLLKKYSPKLQENTLVRRFSDPDARMYGFRSLAHTIAIPRQFPDWSLPIYWADNDGWRGMRLKEGV